MGGNFSDYKGLVSQYSYSGDEMLEGMAGQTNLDNYSYLYQDNIYNDGVKTLSYAPLDQYKVTSAVYPPGNAYLQLCVGAFVYPGRWWDGDVIEIVSYSDVKNTADRQKVENYLMNKYGL